MKERELQGVGYGLPVIHSEIFPARFRHGFTTRRGGVSRDPFDSLNLGGKWGDQPAAVAENQRRLREAGVGGAAIHFASQVHGAAVARVPRSAGAIAHIAAARADAVLADGVVTGARATAGDAVGVVVADCVPILVANVASGACAAVHAGWRGTVAGVLPATLLALLELPDARAADLRVAIGPSIGPCCFEVGLEVVVAVEQAFPRAKMQGAIRDTSPPPSPSPSPSPLAPAKPRVDLWRLNQIAAMDCGIAPVHIDVAGMCTFCQPDRFFSYRRDRGHTGQMAAFIQLLPEP